MEKALLDTEILKGKDSQVVETGDRYLGEHGRFAFSAITFYEVVRGFRAKRTVRALNSFLKLAEDSDVLPVSIAVLERAANLWADALHGGYPRNDADLIIAATAIEAGRILVSGNTTHFEWISGISLADWRSASP